MSDSDINFLPKGLFNDEGGYVLQTPDNYALVKFVWTGALLPTNEQDFKRRVGVSDDAYNRLKAVLDPLIEVYTTAQKNCSNFQTTTYPNLVAIASSTLDYAANVGGNIEDSYYGIIFDDILKLGKEKDPKETNRLKQQINALIESSVRQVNDLTIQANGVVKNLQDFRLECNKNKANLHVREKAVHDALDRDGDDIKRLKKEIQQCTIMLSKDQRQYDELVRRALQAGQYSWVNVIGIIVDALSMVLLDRDGVAQLKLNIERLQQILTNDEEKLREDNLILANLTVVDSSFESVLDELDPAITVILEMIGNWGSIRDDLTSIQTFVQNDVHKAQSIISGIQKTVVINKWNALATTIRQYRETAYVSTPATLSVEEYVEQLGQEIRK